MCGAKTARAPSRALSRVCSRLPVAIALVFTSMAPSVLYLLAVHRRRVVSSVLGNGGNENTRDGDINTQSIHPPLTSRVAAGRDHCSSTGGACARFITLIATFLWGTVLRSVVLPFVSLAALSVVIFYPRSARKRRSLICERYARPSGDAPRLHGAANRAKPLFQDSDLWKDTARKKWP